MPNASPNVSQGNIDHVGYARVGFALGMGIHFMLFVSCSLGLGSQRNFWWNTGLRYEARETIMRWKRGEKNLANEA